MIPELLESRAEAPRRKFRGKRRYFRGVLAEAEAFQVVADPGSWWDLWHYHADWPGWGNLRWQYRRNHLEALALVFRRVARLVQDELPQAQAWILLSGRDAGEDAVYLHTPSPSGSPFPVHLSNIVDEDDGRLLPLLGDVLPEFEFRVVHSRGMDEWASPPRPTSNFFIYADGVGTPLGP